MLTLRQEQVDALAADLRRRVLDGIATMLAGSWMPERPLQEAKDMLRRFVAVGAARAESYGLVTERQIARYVNLMVVMGPRFDLQPWAQNVLTNPADEGEVKIEMLCKSAVGILQDAERE